MLFSCHVQQIPTRWIATYLSTLSRCSCWLLQFPLMLCLDSNLQALLLNKMTRIVWTTCCRHGWSVLYALLPSIISPLALDRQPTSQDSTDDCNWWLQSKPRAELAHLMATFLHPNSATCVTRRSVLRLAFPFGLHDCCCEFINKHCWISQHLCLEGIGWCACNASNYMPVLGTFHTHQSSQLLWRMQRLASWFPPCQQHSCCVANQAWIAFKRGTGGKSRRDDLHRIAAPVRDGCYPHLRRWGCPGKVQT